MKALNGILGNVANGRSIIVRKRLFQVFMWNVLIGSDNKIINNSFSNKFQIYNEIIYSSIDTNIVSFFENRILIILKGQLLRRSKTNEFYFHHNFPQNYQFFEKQPQFMRIRIVNEIGSIFRSKHTFPIETISETSHAY